MANKQSTVCEEIICLLCFEPLKKPKVRTKTMCYNLFRILMVNELIVIAVSPYVVPVTGMIKAAAMYVCIGIICMKYA